MKSYAVALFVAQAVLLQNTYAQCLPSFLPNLGLGPFVGSAPLLAPPCSSVVPPCSSLVAPSIVSPSVVAPVQMVQSNSVANSLADTLSLLTVSSLLSQSLPLGYDNIISVPSVSLGGCGCGLPVGGCGFGLGYGSYLI